MTHEEFYKEVVAVKNKNYGDPADFANDVLALLGKFKVENAAQQSVLVGEAYYKCSLDELSSWTTRNISHTCIRCNKPRN
jgi:hypothetical protein